MCSRISAECVAHDILRRMWKLALAVGRARTGGAAQNAPLRPADIVKLPSAPPAAHIAYGGDPNQFADLRLPEGRGPWPVIAILHGGCWAEYADVTYTAPLATALTREGWATWNVEYRRVHQEGGGWPGTFTDAARGWTPCARRRRNIRSIWRGRSRSGTRRAVNWRCGRRRAASCRRRARSAWPIRCALRAVVSIGGVPDMRAFAAGPGDPCDGRQIRVMGGLPAEFPDRYALVSPAERLPLGVPQVLIWGERDTVAAARAVHRLRGEGKVRGRRGDVGHGAGRRPSRPDVTGTAGISGDGRPVAAGVGEVGGGKQTSSGARTCFISATAHT